MKRTVLLTPGQGTEVLLLNPIIRPSQYTGRLAKNGVTVPGSSVKVHSYGLTVTIPSSYAIAENIPSELTVHVTKSGGAEELAGNIHIRSMLLTYSAAGKFLILDATGEVPPGTPADTLIFRRTE